MTHRIRKTMTIERQWSSLQAGGSEAQTRLDSTHPHELYADFVPPDGVGLLAILTGKPPTIRPMRAVELRIPTIAAIDSDRNQPPVPIEASRGFR